MARYSRRKFLAVGGATVGLGLVGQQADGYTKARVTSVLSPLPGIRATGKPLAVRKQVTSRDVKYRPKTDEVRIVIARNADGAVEFATEPFEQWAEFEAGSIATHTVQENLPTRVGTTDDIMSAMGSQQDQPFVSVVPTGPAITRRELVAKLPNHVTTTVLLAGNEHTTDIPVVVGKRQQVQLV